MAIRDSHVCQEPSAERERRTDISLENNVLTIRGEKKEEKEEREKERYLYERYFGSFQRALTLPAPVQEHNVAAEFRNGVLKIHMPKAPEAKGRKIPING